MKINITNLIVAGAVIFAIPAFSLAQTVEGQTVEGQNIGGVVAGVPAVEGQNTGGATTGAPATDGQNAGGASSVPASEGQNVGGGSSVPASEGQNIGGATASTNTSTGSNTGEETSHTISSSGSRVAIFTTTGGIGSTGSCAILSGYLNPGDTGIEVTKLQTFLKSLNYIVNVTGIYDAQTTEAVMAFQMEYANDILAPWGITRATGHVYLTTLKKINSLACNLQISFTAAENAQLNSYKSNPQGSPETQIVGMGNSSGLTGTVITPGNTTMNGDSNTNASDTQVAAVAKTSIFSKIWEFIKRIFGR